MKIKYTYITGPPCSGKSTVAEGLKLQWRRNLVPMEVPVYKLLDLNGLDEIVGGLRGGIYTHMIICWQNGIPEGAPEPKYLVTTEAN